jgi:putative ABC transport system permease protein
VIRLETVRVAVRELSGNKMRTALTTLGVVFGVAAVIAMVSIAEGARHEALEQVLAMGADTLHVQSKELAGQDLARARQLGVRGLSLDDVDVLARLPGVAGVAPMTTVDAPVRAGERSADVRVVGTTPSHAAIVSQRVAVGRYLADEDLADRASVAVLGARAARELLPLSDPVGAEIRIGDQAFRVVGVLEDRRQATTHSASLGVADTSADVHIPLTTARVRFASDPLAAPLREVAVKVTDGSTIRAVAALVTDALLRRHGGVSTVEVVVPEELLRQGQRSQRIFNVVMGAIASISLVVGGIGIMNVMLVTVTQRTREIGIRRACGATRRDVRDQFLVESLLIACLGGVAGIGLGAALALGIATYAGWLTIVSPLSVAVAFVVAGATGVAFGLFPAIKASLVDPIECLRHE